MRGSASVVFMHGKLLGTITSYAFQNSTDCGHKP